MADSDIPTLEDLASELAEPREDVNLDTVAAEPTEAESSTEETTEPAGESSDETEGDDSTEEVEPETEETEEEKPVSKADERKQQLNTEIRDLVTQRREIMQDIERLNAQVYSPQSVDDIMAETGQDQTEARLTAMEQQRELDRYNTQIAETQLVLRTEAQRVQQDFPMFNPNSPEYNEALANQADRLLGSSLEFDQNTNQVVGSKISPYELYQTIASANQASAVENQLKGQKAALQQQAAVEPQSSASETKTVKEDPFLAGLTKGYGDRLSTGN